jgi:hypothetical protein
MQKHKPPLCLKEYFVERIEGLFEVKAEANSIQAKTSKKDSFKRGFCFLN